MEGVSVVEHLPVRGGARPPASIREGRFGIGILLEGDLALAPPRVQHHAVEPLERDAAFGGPQHLRVLLDDGPGDLRDEPPRVDLDDADGIQADRDVPTLDLRLERQPARPREEKERPRARDRRVALGRAAEALVDEELPGGQERVRPLPRPLVGRFHHDRAGPTALGREPGREAHDEVVDAIRPLDAPRVPGVEVRAHGVRRAGARLRLGRRREDDQGQRGERGQRVRPRASGETPAWRRRHSSPGFSSSGSP